jgi:hypothetical protein
MDVAAKRELEEFVDACMARWDSIKAVGADRRRTIMTKTRLQCHVVSKRKKRSRQETLEFEASSFTVLTADNEKAAEEEREEGVGDGKSRYHSCTRAFQDEAVSASRFL